MPQLSCENVSLGYDGKVVVSNLNFIVNSGDYLCIVGENGSGKSTLVKTILKLNRPLSGAIIMNADLKDEIGYLPQQTAVQKDFPASVNEVVLSGCLNRHGLRPFYSKQEKQSANGIMKRLGIINLAKSCYRELSGGQQQRVLLARALCAAGKILLVDEPTAGLDPKAAADMYTLINELNKSGVTIIMISHDIASALKYASHILHIGVSKPLFFGKASDYLNSEVGKNYAEVRSEFNG